MKKASFFAKLVRRLNEVLEPKAPDWKPIANRNRDLVAANIKLARQLEEMTTRHDTLLAAFFQIKRQPTATIFEVSGDVVQHDRIYKTRSQRFIHTYVLVETLFEDERQAREKALQGAGITPNKDTDVHLMVRPIWSRMHA